MVGDRLRSLSSKIRVVLVTEKVSQLARRELAKVWDEVIDVDAVSNDHEQSRLRLLGRPELNETYTKIEVWNLVQFSRIVFLDADTLPLQTLDALFDVLDPHTDAGKIGAAPDIGWPDIFNSGVFVACPNKPTYEKLCNRAAEAGASFDGGDQGLLNQFFTESDHWKRIPFTYNVTPNATYQYIPAYKRYEKQINLVHFIGPDKPWKREYTPSEQQASDVVDESKSVDMAQKWADAYHSSFGGKQDRIIKGILKPVRDLVIDESRIIQPPPNRWDASKFRPPRRSEPEAKNFVETSVQNAWDVPQDTPAFVPPPLGESLVQFPWEEATVVAERVFPEDRQPEPIHEQDSQPMHDHSVKRKVSFEEPAPPEPEPVLESEPEPEHDLAEVPGAPQPPDHPIVGVVFGINPERRFPEDEFYNPLPPAPPRTEETSGQYNGNDDDDYNDEENDDGTGSESRYFNSLEDELEVVSSSYQGGSASRAPGLGHSRGVPAHAASRASRIAHSTRRPERTHHGQGHNHAHNHNHQPVHQPTPQRAFHHERPYNPLHGILKNARHPPDQGGPA